MLLSDKMEEKVQQIQFQQEISNYKDEIRDLQEKLETLKVRKSAKKAFEIYCIAVDPDPNFINGAVFKIKFIKLNSHDTHDTFLMIHT